MVTAPKIHGGLGIQRLHEMNKACILKLVRGMQNQGQDMWSKVLKGKYHNNSNNGDPISRATYSHLWRNMLKLRTMLEDNWGWSVRNGKKIDITHDVWIKPGLRLVDTDVHIPDNCMHDKGSNYAKDG